MKTWLHDPAPGRPCAIIGEVAQAHDGSLGTAHAFIDAIAKAGATAVKFQTHIAAAESTPGEPWRKHFSPQDETRYDYWRRMEFTEAQWAGLKAHADEKGLSFLSSPFSMQALELLKRVGVAGWKVASGEISNVEMLDAMIATRLPIILSTGMSGVDEVADAVARIRKGGVPVAVLQCATLYPCPPEAVGLNVIEDYRQRFGGAVGLSDHSATIYPGLAAATIGIEVLEVHVTLSRDMFGPDVVASLTPTELEQLVKGIRFIEAMRAHPVDKEKVAAELQPLRKIFMKSVVAARDLKKGQFLERSDLAAKKPGTGIPARDLPGLIGRRLKRDLAADALLSADDLEPG